MWNRVRPLFVGSIFAGTLAAYSSVAGGEPPNPRYNNPSCIHYSAQATLGVAGYNHWVTVANGCSRSAECTIVTSANPNPIDVTVPASEERTVITYRESPARVFDVTVRCKLS